MTIQDIIRIAQEEGLGKPLKRNDDYGEMEWKIGRRTRLRVWMIRDDYGNLSAIDVALRFKENGFSFSGGWTILPEETDELEDLLHWAFDASQRLVREVDG